VPGSRWGGCRAGTTIRRSRRSWRIAAPATATWPACGGSNRPPNTPTRERHVISGTRPGCVERPVDPEPFELRREHADGAVVVGVEVGEAALDPAPGDPQETAVTEDAKLAPGRRLGAVDEEVRELGLHRLRALRLDRNLSEERVLELGDPLAGRRRADERRPGLGEQRLPGVRRNEVDL
jgi:hypothetical protein